VLGQLFSDWNRKCGGVAVEFDEDEFIIAG
jgi:hypothetical protein